MHILGYMLVTLCTFAFCIALLRLFIQGTQISQFAQLELLNSSHSARFVWLSALLFGVFAGKFYSEIVAVFSPTTWWPYGLCATAALLGYLWGRENGPLQLWGA